MVTLVYLNLVTSIILKNDAKIYEWEKIIVFFKYVHENVLFHARKSP